MAAKWLILCSVLLYAAVLVSADRSMKLQVEEIRNFTKTAGGYYYAAEDSNLLLRVVNFLWQSGQSGYQHVWPVSRFSCFFSFISIHHCFCFFIWIF